jgi:predicted small secreted protein
MRRNLATIFISLLVLSGGSALLSGCNTTSGAGKDVSSVGRVITESAEDAK